MSKILFLDIDGVLCTARSHIAYNGPGGMWEHLDPVAVKIVERLCVDHNLEMVLSSTWRHHFDKRAMTHILRNAGFSQSPKWHSNWRTKDMGVAGEAKK